MQRRGGRFVHHLFEKIQLLDNCYIRQVRLSTLSNDMDIEFYLDGEYISDETSKLIKSAKKEILFQFYKFNDKSDAGRDLKYALIDLNEKAMKTDRTIDIKFFVNHRIGLAALATKKHPHPFTWLLEHEKGTYIILNEEKYDLSHLNIEYKLHEHHFFDCYHAKQIIIDRKVIMLRSGDISKENDYTEEQESRTDCATIIYNPTIASAAAESFHARFQTSESTIEKYNEKLDYYPPGKNVKGKGLPAIPLEEHDGIPILLLEKNPSTDFFKKLTNKSPYKIAILEAIKQARSGIKIITPNLNDKDIVDELISAIKRGVTVKLVTGKFHNHFNEAIPTMGGNNQFIIQSIYNALPLQLWDKFEVRWAQSKEGRLIGDHDPIAMHSKGVIVDDKIVIAGSSPLDKQAIYFSGESDYVVESEEIASKFLSTIFDPVFNRGRDAKSFLLETIKSSLVQDINKRISFTSLLINPVKNIKNLTENKKSHKDLLIKKIQNATNLEEIYNYLVEATKVEQSNPFAYERRQGLFSNETIGETTAIRQLRTIMIRHFNDKLFLPEKTAVTTVLKP